jgi:hypothetical protein
MPLYLNETRIRALVELAKAADKADIALVYTLVRIWATNNTRNLYKLDSESMSGSSEYVVWQENFTHRTEGASNGTQSVHDCSETTNHISLPKSRPNFHYEKSFLACSYP